MRHPFVERWLESAGSLQPIADALPRPLEPAVAAILKARGVPGAPTDAPDLTALDLDALDPDLGMFVCSTLAVLAEREGNEELLRWVHRRARALVTPDTPAEISTIALRIEQRLPEVRADLARREALQRRVLQLRGPLAPRTAGSVMALAFFLAELGRATELEPELDRIEREGPPELQHAADVVRFVDRVRTGRVAAAAPMLNRVEHGGDIAAAIVAPVTECLRLLPVMLAVADGETPPAPERDAAEWELTTRALLAGRVAEALERARRDAATPAGTDEMLNGQSFVSQLLIRAELAAGNVATARRLLARRQAAGNRLPLDGVLEARLARLEGDAAAAAGGLAEAFQVARRLDALGRLRFELALAPELPRGDAAQLAYAAALGATQPAPVAQTPTARARPLHRRGVRRLVGESPALRSVRRQVEQFAPLELPVLIVGETGTGKEEVARALHEAGPRAREPFVAVNCAAIPQALIEAELFGHARGAFTGATAARQGVFVEAGAGTLLLDELGAMPPEQQARLLRVLETRQVRPVGGRTTRRVLCRVLAATNRDPDRAVADGELRADLLYRLRQFEIRIPALRDRPEDLRALARHFLEGDGAGRSRPQYTRGFDATLAAHRWPGNVRELRAVVERIRLLAPAAPVYEREHVVAALGPAEGGAPDSIPLRARRRPRAAESVLATGRSRMRRRERLRELLRRHDRITRVEAADILGVSRMTAGADLRALVVEGFAHKVCPTPAPRSHYFERTGAPA